MKFNWVPYNFLEFLSSLVVKRVTYSSLGLKFIHSSLKNDFEWHVLSVISLVYANISFVSLIFLG